MRMKGILWIHMHITHQLTWLIGANRQQCNSCRPIAFINLLEMTCIPFMGGIAGAFGFNRLGYVSTLPLALLLISLALVPMLDDLRSGWRRFRRARQV